MIRIQACALLLAAAAIPSFAQTSDSTCILAGRLGDSGWAPRMAGVQLLAQDGRTITAADKQTLSGIKQVRLASPSLLSRCDGSKELAVGPDTVGPKSRAPAVRAGVLAVKAVNFPKLRRGGELVELEVTVPAERVTMVSR